MLASAKEQFKNGTPLFGQDGSFHKIREDFLKASLEGEMDSSMTLKASFSKMISYVSLSICVALPGTFTHFTQVLRVLEMR